MSATTLPAQKHISIEGCRASYFESGTLGKLPLLLMHGLGPGASVSGAFAAVRPFLDAHFHVFAMDLIGFGTSGQKPAPPYFDFPLWVRQARAVLGLMPAAEIGVFGHSASGAIALRLAASEPRIAAVITTGTAGTRFDVNGDLKRLWTFPDSREDLRGSLRSLIHDPTRVTESGLDARWGILQSSGYREYFTAMFAGNLQLLADSWIVTGDELKGISADYTLVHGRDDLPCPVEATSMRLAHQIRHANLVLLSRCGHAPALEHPEQVCAAVRLAFASHVNFGEI